MSTANTNAPRPPHITRDLEAFSWVKIFSVLFPATLTAAFPIAQALGYLSSRSALLIPVVCATASLAVAFASKQIIESRVNEVVSSVIALFRLSDTPYEVISFERHLIIEDPEYKKVQRIDRQCLVARKRLDEITILPDTRVSGRIGTAEDGQQFAPVVSCSNPDIRITAPPLDEVLGGFRQRVYVQPEITRGTKLLFSLRLFLFDCFQGENRGYWVHPVRIPTKQYQIRITCPVGWKATLGSASYCFENCVADDFEELRDPPQSYADISQDSRHELVCVIKKPVFGAFYKIRWQIEPVVGDSA